VCQSSVSDSLQTFLLILLMLILLLQRSTVNLSSIGSLTLKHRRVKELETPLITINGQNMKKNLWNNHYRLSADRLVLKFFNWSYFHSQKT